MQCLICEKDIQTTHKELYDDAGFILISFHFGSRFDQCKGCGGRDHQKDASRLQKLLACDEIEACICDDCFEKKSALCRGFSVEKKYVRKEKVEIEITEKQCGDLANDDIILTDGQADKIKKIMKSKKARPRIPIQRLPDRHL